MYDLTPNQRDAVETDGSLLIVRAGAGSGKTRVLVERYLRLVLDRGIAPARILAATFTEKAAAEMKERVCAALLQANRPELISELNAAPICTLHSFCSRLILPFALQMGLDPAYRIIEEHDARLLQEEILASILARWLAQNAEKLDTVVARLHWAGDYSARPGRSPASLGFSRQFLNLIQSARCAGKARQEPIEPLGISPSDAEAQVRFHIQQLDSLLGTQGGKITPKSLEKASAARRFLDGYLRLSDRRNPHALEIIESLGKISLNVSKEVKPFLTPIKQTLCPLLTDLFYLPNYESIRLALNELFVEFSRSYREAKVQRGLMDFLDLEEMALDILNWPDPPVPADVILIDEAQDLNPVQWEIVHHLRRSAPLFAVGDPQQSIYGFRDAAVHLFSELAQAARRGAGREVTLAVNYRSRQPLLDVVNCLFEQLWVDDERVPFLKLAAGRPQTESAEPRVELLISFAQNRQEARELEAHFLAQRLLDLAPSPNGVVREAKDLDSDPHLDRLSGASTWGDVLVLVRTGSSFAPLERAFHKFGIPFILQAGRGFWDALEISDLLNLLRSLEDPYDDFSLACVLRSPAINFSDDDLLELRMNSEPLSGDATQSSYRPLLDGLKTLAASKTGAGNLPGRADLFLKLFQRLQFQKDCLPLREMLGSWLAETGLEAIWAQDPEGGLIAGNVRKFLRLCDTQAGESAARLRTLFEEMRLRDLQESAAAVGSEAGAVRIMTVHAAKGLEAPIVALFDLNHKPRPETAAFVYSLEKGAAFAVETMDFAEQPHKPQRFREIGDDVKRRSDEEERRILYVALTRAQEKLLLSAGASTNDKGAKSVNGWLKLICGAFHWDEGELFDPIAMPAGLVPVFNRGGIPANILLRRAADISAVGRPPGRMPAPSTKFSPPPKGFPAPSRAADEPLSVIEYLHREGKFPPLDRKAQASDDLDGKLHVGGLAIGSWVHRVLEVCLRQTESNLDGILRAEAKSFFAVAPTKDEFQRAKELISNFLTSPLAAQATNAKRRLIEFPILFKLNGVLLKGKLDLVFEVEQGWIIVDYKTNRQVDDALIAAYSAQMALYAQAWQLLTGQRPHRTSIFWLSSSEVFDLPPETIAEI